jgi:SAM-dependent methyltransferase
MKASSKEFMQTLAYMRASRELYNWITGARVIALLSGALESGILDALLDKKTPEMIAAATHMDLQSVRDVCLALAAHGVVVQIGESYRLSQDYEMLSSPNAIIPLASLIRQAMVMVRTLQVHASPDTIYTHMSPDEILAMAGGAGISAISSAPHVAQETTGKMLPEVEALWLNGARHLEVGCGVGNALLGIALTYPQVRATGIEIDELTANETKRRIDLLGLADRVDVRVMDACQLQDEETFDTVQWSQFFFPTESRAIVLNAMLRALKPGGYLLMPYMGLPTSDPVGHRRQMLRHLLRALRTGSIAFVSFFTDILGDNTRRRRMEKRGAAMQQLMFQRWGVSVLDVAELTEEVKQSGFEVIRTLDTVVSQFVLTRGFLLAKKKEN